MSKIHFVFSKDKTDLENGKKARAFMGPISKERYEEKFWGDEVEYVVFDIPSNKKIEDFFTYDYQPEKGEKYVYFVFNQDREIESFKTFLKDSKETVFNPAKESKKLPSNLTSLLDSLYENIDNLNLESLETLLTDILVEVNSLSEKAQQAVESEYPDLANQLSQNPEDANNFIELAEKQKEKTAYLRVLDPIFEQAYKNYILGKIDINLLSK